MEALSAIEELKDVVDVDDDEDDWDEVWELAWNATGPMDDDVHDAITELIEVKKQEDISENPLSIGNHDDPTVA
mgnify:CR=1 FL=1